MWIAVIYFPRPNLPNRFEEQFRLSTQWYTTRGYEQIHTPEQHTLYNRMRITPIRVVGMLPSLSYPSHDAGAFVRSIGFDRDDGRESNGWIDVRKCQWIRRGDNIISNTSDVVSRSLGWGALVQTPIASRIQLSPKLFDQSLNPLNHTQKDNQNKSNNDNTNTIRLCRLLETYCGGLMGVVVVVACVRLYSFDFG